MGHVALDGVARDAQLLGDCLGTLVLQQVGKDLRLSWREGSQLFDDDARLGVGYAVHVDEVAHDDIGAAATLLDREAQAQEGAVNQRHHR